MGLELADPLQLAGWVPLALNGFWSLAVMAIPVSIGLAILRYRLYDIDLLINRTLVYGALTGCVIGVYVLVVGYFALLFQARGDLVSLLAAGVAAVLFQPLRERLQTGVNRLLYGQRDDPNALLVRLGQRLETTLEPEAVLSTVVETVRDALKLSYAGLLVRSDGRERVAAEVGTRSAIALRLDLPYLQEVVGAIVLGPRGPGEELQSTPCA
jgi:hypothetical protein